MDILLFSENLQAGLREKINEFNVEQDELLKVGSLMTVIRQTITELKTFTSKYKFQDEAEEIKFFKEVKPVFLSQFYYYKKVFAVRLFDSFKDERSKQANYYRMLTVVETFSKKNYEFYKYCMANNSDMDSYYFVRSRRGLKSISKDERFTTGYDVKLGRILANELLKTYLLKALQRMSRSEVSHNLIWTGQKAALIELIYALHTVQAFNKGNAEIKMIATTFENLFSISLGNYYRVIQEIRTRKSGQTNFMDQLKEKLLERFRELE